MTEIEKYFERPDQLRLGAAEVEVLIARGGKFTRNLISTKHKGSFAIETDYSVRVGDNDQPTTVYLGTTYFKLDHVDH